MKPTNINNIISDFKPVDNFQRNIKLEEDLILNEKVSMLLESSNIDTKLIPDIYQHKWSNGNWRFKLPQPITINDSFLDKSYRKMDCSIAFNFFLLALNNGKIDGFNLDINDIGVNNSEGKIISFPGCKSCHDKVVKYGRRVFDDYSLWDLLQPYCFPGGIEQAFNCFNNDSRPYSPFKLPSTHIAFSPEFRWVSSDSDVKYIGIQELDSNLASLITNHNHTVQLFTEYEKYFDEWYKTVYSFKNESGGIEQKVIKCIETQTRKKLFIPVSSWHKKGCGSLTYCVPHPKKQILYNLDLIHKNKPEFIVLCDSIDIADLNQEHSPSNVVWTSWLSHDIDQVDWEPLKNTNAEIYLLVTNHSNMNLAEAYLKADKFANYLMGKHKIDLQFIQVEVAFDDENLRHTHFSNMKDVLLYRCNNNSEVLPESVIIMNYDEFQEMCRQADTSLNTIPRRFWESEVEESEEENTSQSNNASLKAIDYLLRPALVRGEIHMLHAPKGKGKSSFVYSLVGAVVARKRLFDEKWWCCPPNGDYQYNKVLYLDFENGAGRIEKRKKEYTIPHLFSTEGKNQECIINLIIEDLKNDTTDYSDPANHQKILDLITQTKSKGVKGQPVDLVVIDTYSQFIGQEVVSTWNKIDPLFKRITAQGIAILLVHHSDYKGESQGFKDKIKPIVSEIVISQDPEDDKTGTLKDPRWIHLRYSRDSGIAIDNQPFKIYFDQKWKVCDIEDCDTAQLLEFGQIAEAYKHEGYKVTEACKMIDLKSTRYGEKLNEYRELKKSK